MSAKDLGWALSRKVAHHHDLLVLAMLANVAREGWTFIGQAKLAERCMISRKSVNESLSRLQSGGFIKRFERWNGNVRTSDHIQILPPHRCNEALQPPVTSGYSIPYSPYGVVGKKEEEAQPVRNLRVVGGRDA